MFSQGADLRERRVAFDEVGIAGDEGLGEDEELEVGGASFFDEADDFLGRCGFVHEDGRERGQSVPQEPDQSLLPTSEPKELLTLTRKNLALLNTLNGDSKRKKLSNCSGSSWRSGAQAPYRSRLAWSAGAFGHVLSSHTGSFLLYLIWELRSHPFYLIKSLCNCTSAAREPFVPQSNVPQKHSSYFESDTMTISTTTSGFAEKAYENDILDPPDSREPPDLGTLRHRLTQRRNSIQPLPAHQRYCEFISSSANEAKALALVQKRIMIDYEDLSLQYRRAINQAITQTPRQDFNDNLSDPRPDLLEGLFTSVLPHSLHNHALHKVNSLPYATLPLSLNVQIRTCTRQSTRLLMMVPSWSLRGTGLSLRREQAPPQMVLP